MYKSLNNSVAEHIVLCACRGQYRFCAYSLYNHYKAETFEPEVFLRLFCSCVSILGDEHLQMFKDDSIDFCVRDTLKRLLLKSLLKGGVYHD